MTNMNWISIDKKLPKCDEYVLMAIQRKDNGFYVEYGRYIGETINGVNFTYYNESGEKDTFYVTHWQPLPKPPKGE